MSSTDNHIEWPWETDEVSEMSPPAHEADAVSQSVPVDAEPDQWTSSDEDDEIPLTQLSQWNGLEIDKPPPVATPSGSLPWPPGASGESSLPAWAQDHSEDFRDPSRRPPWDEDEDWEDEEDEEEDWEDEEDEEDDDLATVPPALATAASTTTAAAIQDDIQLDEDCPPDKLRELAKHISQYVRVQVASHRNCPDDVMSQLAQDSSHMVRWALWSRDNLPAEVLSHVDLELLPADETYMIAVSPACSYEQTMAWYNERPDDNTMAVLSIMHKDAPDSWVQQILEGLPESVRLQLARSSPSERMQRFLFQDPAMLVQLADNPNCSPDLLAELAKSESIKVRELVVQHQHAPIEALITLLKDEDKRLSHKAARHPNLPEEYRQLARLT